MINILTRTNAPDFDFFIAKIIRFVFAVSSNTMRILCPLVAYKMTSSLTIAGLLVLAEWLPKVLVYLYAADIIKKYGMRSIHPNLEFARFISLLLLIPAFMGWLPWWLMIVSFIATHCVVAVMNVAYEANVKQWLHNSSIGHASLIQIDTVAGIMAMLLCFFVDNYTVLAMVMVSLSIALIVILKLYAERLYRLPHDNMMKIEILSPIKALSTFNTKLVGMVLVGLASGMPLGVIMSALPFFIEYGLGHVVALETISVFSFLHMAGGFIVMHCSIRLLAKKSDFMIFLGGTALNFFCLIALSFTGGYAYVALMVMFCATYNVLHPWQRSTRQKIMRDNGTETLTGMIIALQGMASFASAMIIWVFAKEQPIIIATAVVYVALLGTGLTMLFGAETVKLTISSVFKRRKETMGEA